jgi:two-component system, LytTR family, response regulator
MKHIAAVIIDDEPDSIALLQLQLEKHCPQIQVLATFTSPTAAVDELVFIKPELVFLDIEMPDLDGFQLLEKLSPVTFKVIFITAYNQYAIKAFRFNALDYLVKPVATEHLVAAVEKTAMASAPLTEQLDQVKQQIKGAPINKIAVSAQSGVIFIEFNDILYAEASGNYAKLVMSDNSHYIISKTLKDIQGVLEEKNFFRIHRQYIINLNKVKCFNRVDALLTMENKAELPVARIQKEKLAERFDWL